jgi:DNA modification methylase
MVKIKLIQGNVLEALKQIPDNSIDTIITSPPYWGLRKYPDSANIIWDGDPNCEHEFELEIQKDPMDRGGKGQRDPGGAGSIGQPRTWEKISTKQGFCKKCGAWYGQLGLEPTLELYIKHLLQITKELKRVLKPTGVMFWNHGDCYGSKPAGNPGMGKKGASFEQRQDTSSFPEKCMALQNYRLILKMIDEQGWILRNSIVWFKPNHLPESCKDRFTRAYENVFMLVKSRKYFFNLDAVREPLKSSTVERIGVRASEEEMKKYDKQGKLKNAEQLVWAGLSRDKTGFVKFRPDLPKPEELISYLRYWKEKKGISFEEIAEKLNMPITSVTHYFTNPDSTHGFAYPSKEIWFKLKEILEFDNKYDEVMSHEELKPSYIPCNVLGKNPGDVWVINTEPFPEAHFATFPTELVRRCIKAGCPEQVCKKCGKPRKIITVTDYIKHRPSGSKIPRQEQGIKIHDNGFGNWKTFGNNLLAIHEIVGWTSCNCNAGFEHGWILDPFVGSGTTIKVAIEERRNCIGIEIVPEYIEMVIRRCNLRNNPLIEFELKVI